MNKGLFFKMISDYLRLKKDEKKRINDLSIALNRQRLELNKNVVEESKFAHMLLEEAFKRISIENGEIVFK